MHTMNRENQRLTSVIGGNRGQSLVITLLILFILVFLGGVFITILTRNISSARHGTETLTADYIAEAGIRFAGDQLTYGNELADWRPTPESPNMLYYAAPFVANGMSASDVENSLKGIIRAGSQQTGHPLTFADLPPDNDPDRSWLLQGYCRFTYGKGRFLLRVTYNPTTDDPMSRFIKIESVGRMGNVDPTDKAKDPTVFSARQRSNLQRYRVAYKAIGITDYARFITNKDHLTDDFNLGAPGSISSLPGQTTGQLFVTTYGQKPATPGDNPLYGAPIRCNGNLVWNGVNYIWLNHNTADAVEVAGDIKYAIRPYGDSDLVLKNDGSLQKTITMGQPWTFINPFKDPVDSTRDNPHPALDSAAMAVGQNGKLQSAFDSAPDDQGKTQLGDYRDGRTAGDYRGWPRAVTRIDPPIIDPSQITGGLNAYRDVTRNSGVWKHNDTSNRWYNTGYYGWGKGLYINNTADVQTETSMYTLRGDWTQPGRSSWWIGPYYAPPGVKIELTPYNIDGQNNGAPEIIITHDSGTNQPEFHWYDKDGNPVFAQGERVIMPYPENGVIFAEGNVRIKGTLAPNKQLTVVSEGTIYVEGNILKCPFSSIGSNVVSTAEGAARDSAISLLATNNVCVNTTQFFGPSTENLMAGNNGDYFEIAPKKPFWMGFSNGVYWGKDPAYQKYVNPASDPTHQYPVPSSLFVRHSNDPSKAGLTYLNMLVNYWTDADISANKYYSLYNFAPLDNTGFPAQDGTTGLDIFDSTLARANYTRILGDAKYGASGIWRDDVFDLWQPPSVSVTGEPDVEVGDHWYKYFRQPGVENRIGFQLDESYDQSLAGTLTGATQGAVDYRLARAAVQPSDIRIEALLYAQGGSFFVIPGEWFNPDPQDTLANLASSGHRPPGVDNRWPFYGQPIDVKITVYGAVAENVPAAPGDVSAWMEKWGWIAPYHGTPESNWTSPLHLDRFTTGYRDPLDPNDPDVDAVKTVNSVGNVPVYQQGLTFVYDRQLSCPRRDPMKATPTSGDGHLDPIRIDDCARMLPVTPKLPVSPQTLYFGQPS